MFPWFESLDLRIKLVRLYIPFLSPCKQVRINNDLKHPGTNRLSDARSWKESTKSSTAYSIEAIMPAGHNLGPRCLGHIWTPTKLKEVKGIRDYLSCAKLPNKPFFLIQKIGVIWSSFGSCLKTFLFPHFRQPKLAKHRTPFQTHLFFSEPEAQW